MSIMPEKDTSTRTYLLPTVGIDKMADARTFEACVTLTHVTYVLDMWYIRHVYCDVIYI
jgi:hypothetical protein